MQLATIIVYTVNSDTVLCRVIAKVRQRRIAIQKLSASFSEEDETSGTIQLQIIADSEQCRLLKAQFEKIMDVLNVSEPITGYSITPSSFCCSKKTVEATAV